MPTLTNWTWHSDVWKRLQQEQPQIANRLKYLIANGYTPEQCKHIALKNEAGILFSQEIYDAGLHLNSHPQNITGIPIVRSGDCYIGQNVISKEGFAGTITQIEVTPLGQQQVIQSLTIEGHAGVKLVTVANTSTLTATDTSPNLDAIANWLPPHLPQFKTDFLGLPSEQALSLQNIWDIVTVLYQQWLTRPEKYIVAAKAKEIIYQSEQTEGVTQ